MDEVDHRIRDLYQDLSACFLALANALEKSGALSKADLQTAAQERLLTLATGSQIADSAFPLLQGLSLHLPPASDV